jgi:hypothetical protein
MSGKLAIFSVILTFIVFNNLNAQYEGLDSNRRQSPDYKYDYSEEPGSSSFDYDKIKYNGADFSAFGSGTVYSLELIPFTGISLNDRFYLAAGGVLSLYSDNLRMLYSGNYGVTSMLRIPISNFFLHMEYRAQNALTDLDYRTRNWYTTPIIGGGFVYESKMNTIVLVGLALNPDYGKTNPLGGIVYRFGIRF